MGSIGDDWSNENYFFGWFWFTHIFEITFQVWGGLGDSDFGCTFFF